MEVAGYQAEVILSASQGIKGGGMTTSQFGSTLEQDPEIL